MKKKRILNRCTAALLTIGIIAGSAFTAFAEAAALPKEAAAEQTAVSENTFFMEGAYRNEPILSMEDAAGVVEDMAGEIGGNEQTQFEPWRTVTDSRGNKYYIFRQMYANVTVSGGAVKVVTDAAGNMRGLISSVEPVPADMEAQEGITAEAAQEIVTQKMENTGHPQTEVIEGYTEKVILPVNLELDPDSEEEKEEVRFVWAVYTNNDKSSMTGGSDLPYLAHFVTTDGEYLYSLPTIIPNDEAGSTGFQSSYVFEFMEPADYTGTVTFSDGTEHEISITLMRDSRTGMYYLGNLERRIVVAECFDFLYNNGKVILEASADNTGWDNTCLLSLYNYCRAWDYYNEIGWKGPDGLETPIVILKDFCDKEHEPVDNAAYAGSYYGWQVFLSSSVNDLSQCLDVLGHEYTHGVTGSVMTYNAYMNDFGAINEAISDIQGNLCEMMTGATEDTTWELGENSSTPVRSMSDPHKHSQPEFAWDIYYKPKVKNPTLSNDRGGVHANSSLLNRIAYLLCTDGGMSFEEARDFWFAVDCSMVPGTDYAQLSVLLPWVMRNLGFDNYLPALEAAIKETRIDCDEMPVSFDEDRALVTLTLPEKEIFEDGNWSLYILSVDAQGIRERLHGILHKEGEYAGALGELADMMKEAAFKYVFAHGGKKVFRDALSAWLQRYFKGMLYLGTGAAGQDGRTVRMVCVPGYTVPVLMYLKFDPSSNTPSGIGMAVFVKGCWQDLVGKAVEAAVNAQKGEEADYSWLESSENDFFYEIRGGELCEIPSDGLEDVITVDEEYMDLVLPM